MPDPAVISSASLPGGILSPILALRGSQAMPEDKLCLPLALEDVKRELVSPNHWNSVAVLIGENGDGSWSP